MTLTRTSIGLSNLHLFLKVDVVVFVEGGQSYTIEKVSMGEGDVIGLDILFWEKFFEFFESRRLLAFRAVGSKTVLREIADKIELGEVSHVFVGMDQDYDSLSNDLIETPGVFYTRGYSWENDVWNIAVARDVFYIVCPTCSSTNDPSHALEKLVGNLGAHLRWPVRADFLLRKYGCSYLNSIASAEIIGKDREKLPVIRKDRLLKHLLASRKSLPSDIILRFEGELPEVPLNCPGHLISQYYYQCIVGLAKEVKSKLTLPLDIFHALAIEIFFKHLRGGTLGEILVWYEYQVARVEEAFEGS